MAQTFVYAHETRLVENRGTGLKEMTASFAVGHDAESLAKAYNPAAGKGSQGVGQRGGLKYFSLKQIDAQIEATTGVLNKLEQEGKENPLLKKNLEQFTLGRNAVVAAVSAAQKPFVGQTAQVRAMV
jgi:hypothetical protein